MRVLGSDGRGPNKREAKVARTGRTSKWGVRHGGAEVYWVTRWNAERGVREESGPFHRFETARAEADKRNGKDSTRAQ